MRYLVGIVSVAAGLALLADAASAQTVEQLKKELAVKNAEIARQKHRLRQRRHRGEAFGQLSVPLA